MKARKTLSLKKPVQVEKPALEYRLIWNEGSQEWDIYRNGLKTGLARRKKRSAIDTAILAVQSDDGAVRADARIVSVKNRTPTIEWTRAKLAAVTGEAKLS